MTRSNAILTTAALLISPCLGAQAPQLTDAEQEAFLANAEIQQIKGLKVGITNSRRATLSDGKFTHDAHVQTIDEFKQRFESPQGTELNFRDSYSFNIAAYRLDRMIGLRMVPVSVERKVRGERASVTWWIDDVQMMALDRFKKKIKPARPEHYNDEMYNVRVFNELVYNTDPNLGNVLITNDWSVRPIDFTRAFRTLKTLRNPKNLARVDRRVYDGLKTLTLESLQATMGTLLNKAQLTGLLARRDLIIEAFDEKIAEAGEAAVICGKPGH